MNQETVDHLASAERSLAKAEILAAIPMRDEAGRAAYYAMYHGAQAFVVDRGMTAAKSRRGLRQLFAQVTKHEPDDVRRLLGPLTNCYRMKSIADYDTSGIIVTAQEAADAISDARQFLIMIRNAVGSTSP